MTAFTLKAAPVQQGLFIPSSFEKKPAPLPVADKRQADMFGGTVTTLKASLSEVKDRKIQMNDYEHTGDLRHGEEDLRAAGFTVVGSGELTDGDGDLIGYVIIRGTAEDARRARDLA